MIDLEKAKKGFEKYLLDFDAKDKKIREKIIHTYNVVRVSKYLSKKMNLSMEEQELAQIIALLHDIGRFEQLKEFNSYEDYNTIDHATAGVILLFEQNMIRKFVEDEKYDEVIRQAIQNHNRIRIDTKQMSPMVLFHSKLIRDSDKIDNFRLQAEVSPEILLDKTMQEIEQEDITEPTYTDLIGKKLVNFSKRKTDVDKWISLVGFIYDLNFPESMEYISQNDYLRKAIHIIDYKNEDTVKKVNEIELVANEYMLERIQGKVQDKEEEFFL